MNLVSEKIDERILRLLGLEDIFDIDYDTYYNLIREAMVAGTKKLPQEELAVLSNERKRIRGKKGRFKPKKITANKVATLKFLKPAKKTLALAPSSTTSPEEGGGFVEIKKTLDSILKTLGSKFKFDQKRADQDRKEEETEKRGKRESTLEGFKKGVSGIVATTKKILSPFQAIIDRIWKFIFFTLLGRAFTKFMDWMSDKGNQEKFNSFIKFLTDHWPALAGLYILFGTSFGKLVRGLLKGVTRMIVALVMNIGKIKRFITKNKKLAFLGLALAPLASRELGNVLGENKETPESGLIPTTNPDLDQAKQSTDQAANTQVPKLNLGGMVPSFKMGGMNPFGGMDFSGGVPISGAGQDDTLIAAKTGEAILTEKDQQDIGQRYVDSTTGQPLSIPQYLAGRKPGSVNMGNLSFPGFGGGFFDGGVISKFKDGGIVGGSSERINLQLSDSQKKALEVLGKYESKSSGGYNAVNQIGTEGGRGISGFSGDFRKMKQHKGRSLTDLTVKEILKLQHDDKTLNDKQWINAGKLHAVGKYQIVGNTLPELVNKLNIPTDTKFSPVTQDAMALQLMKERGIQPWIGPSDKATISERAIIENARKEKINIKPNTLQKPTIIPKKSNKKTPTFIDRLGEIANKVGSGFSGMSKPPSATANPQKTPTKPQRWATDPRGWFGMKGGGSLTELGGIGKVEESEKGSIDIPGAGADRQGFQLLGGGSVALQPGENVITKFASQLFGQDNIDRINALDFNSEARRRGVKPIEIGKGTVKRPQITPYKTFGSGSGGMITLPPITQSAGGSRARSAGLGGGSEVDYFSATALAGEEARAKSAGIYGLLG